MVLGDMLQTRQRPSITTWGSSGDRGSVLSAASALRPGPLLLFPTESSPGEEAGQERGEPGEAGPPPLGQRGCAAREQGVQAWTAPVCESEAAPRRRHCHRAPWKSSLSPLLRDGNRCWTAASQIPNLLEENKQMSDNLEYFPEALNCKWHLTLAALWKCILDVAVLSLARCSIPWADVCL